MHPNCIVEIAAAIGRQPTKAELAAVEAGLLRHMRNLARTDPKWQGMSGQERLQAAADNARAEAIAAADKAADRRASNLLAQARETQRILDRAAEIGGKTAHHDALFERLRNVDDYIAGVRNEGMSNIVSAIDAVEPKFFGLIENAENVRAFARAVRDGNTSDPVMARAAKAYTDGIEGLRTRANAAGADIGKLDYGYLPQAHDTGRVARAGKDGWATAVFPRLDRTQYVDASGNIMGDAEVMDVLRSAWETIATEGRNDRVPGQARGGSRAARFDNKHRAIHFKDADSYLDYLQEFGRGSMMTAIHGHVGMMAKTIGMTEEFGANPTSTYRLLKDLAEQRDNTQGVHQSFASLDMVWDTLNGATAQPVSANLARFWQGMRNFTTAVKLQGVMLSAITDAPLQVIVAKSSGVPMGKAVSSLFAGVGKQKRALARELAIGLDSVSGEMATWHKDNLAQGWSAKLANTTMRLTLIEAWTNALRRGYALTLSGTLHRMRQTDWSAMQGHDRNRMQSAGVTEADWKVWQLASATDMNGTPILTKEGLRGISGADLQAHGLTAGDVDRATTRMLGYLDQEAKTAVLAPDLMTRAMVQQGTRSGTWGGETLRSMMLFKSWSVGVVDKHFRRLKNIPTTQGKVAYSAAMMSSLTLFGAMTLQLRDLISGKDPRDMSTPKFWLAAFMQGGGLGVFGDVLYTGMGGDARGGQANWTSLAGPVFGNMIDAADLTLGNAARAAAGKKTDVGADLIRLARGNIPFVNLWYWRAAFDHLVFHDLQEQASPGYLRRMRQRAQKDWGQRYWWEPGKKLPDRAPDVEAAFGKK